MLLLILLQIFIHFISPVLRGKIKEGGVGRERGKMKERKKKKEEPTSAFEPRVSLW